MSSYQNFIATISNALTFNLKSEDGRYVRVSPRTLNINGQLQNRQVLNLNNDPGQAATLVLKDFPNTDNFNLFIETRTAETTEEFPVNIVVDITGAQFLQVDTDRSGIPLRIDPDVSFGVVVQFAEFRVAGQEPTPTLVADAFGFLRVGGGFLVPRFGFEAVLPNINIVTVPNWRPILPFILNGGSLVGIVQQVEAGLAATIIGGIVGGVIVLYAIPVVIGTIALLIALLNRTAQIPPSTVAAAQPPPAGSTPFNLKPISQWSDADFLEDARQTALLMKIPPHKIPLLAQMVKNGGCINFKALRFGP